MENIKKTVGKSIFDLDTKAPNENSRESGGPGSPYLNLPVRSLDQAVNDLGIDRHGDLLSKNQPPASTPAALPVKPAVLVHLARTKIAGATAPAVSAHFPQTDAAMGTMRRVANAK